MDSRQLLILYFTIKQIFSGGKAKINLHPTLKDIDYCQIETIKGLTDKGQYRYLTQLMGPQEGTYLYTPQFHSLR